MVKSARNKAATEVIAVTGASNYLGVGLMNRLLADERVGRIVALDTQAPSIEHPKLVHHMLDLTNPSAPQLLHNVFQKEKVTRLVHLIFTYTLSRNRALAHELEAIGTMQVLDAASAAGIRRIVARSTTAIYGAKPGNPNFLTEFHEPDDAGDDSFISDKLELERQMRQFAREHGECRVAILRDCTSLGPTSINYLSGLLLLRRTPRVLGFDPLMQFIHEDDLFRAYAQVTMDDSSGTYNIVGKGVIRFSEAVARAGGCEIRLPESVLRLGSSVFWSLKLLDIPPSFIDHLKYSWVADGTRAVAELGFVPHFDGFEALKEFKKHRRSRNGSL